MPAIGKTIVTEDLFAFAKSICSRGGKVFLSKMAEDHTGAMPTVKGCTNCNGGGRLMVEYLVTAVGEGPFMVQAGGEPERNPTTSMVYKGEWAGKKMKSFSCPACQSSIKIERDIKQRGAR